jgi:hypothetical protein
MNANILTYSFSFTQDNVIENNYLCNVRCQLLVVGDLKFYAQLVEERT